MKPLRPILAALALSLASPAAAQPADDATVVATVNGEAITLGEMRALKAGMGPQAAALPDAALWDMILDQITRQTAVAQAGEGNLTPRDEALLALQRRSLLATIALEAVAEPEPTEEELRAAYDALWGSAGEVTEYSAQHILVETEEAAQAVAAEIEGGKDFGQVAEERSTDSSGPGGGDLGWFTLDMMVAPFAEAVGALEKGEVSAPVESQFGWHVIRLNESRLKEAPAFEEVRDQMAQQVRRERVEAEVQRITGEAEVERTEGLSPDLLGAE
ncbi:peptidylprolyl isomerase [Paracoccus sp. S-4012]|uniref:peptidylprolyl isomerase n=1 Tax=Paracoccus sp. S-4012 TaxID=2665648 RepID=UPI0012AFAB1F|nr:peptidylprolyl isomerase [Paracoccus sp. S-4012]MRX49266.1 peptidylprolyl isomerase [Paracoccus sp. S-4012]